MNVFCCEVNVKRFGFDNLIQDFNIINIAVHGAMGASRNHKAKKMYITVYSAFLS